MVRNEQNVVKQTRKRSRSVEPKSPGKPLPTEKSKHRRTVSGKGTNVKMSKTESVDKPGQTVDNNAKPMMSNASKRTIEQSNDLKNLILDSESVSDDKVQVGLNPSEENEFMADIEEEEPPAMHRLDNLMYGNEIGVVTPVDNEMVNSFNAKSLQMEQIRGDPIFQEMVNQAVKQQMQFEREKMVQEFNARDKVNAGGSAMGPPGSGNVQSKTQPVLVVDLDFLSKALQT